VNLPSSSVNPALAGPPRNAVTAGPLNGSAESLAPEGGSGGSEHVVNVASGGTVVAGALAFETEPQAARVMNAIATAKDRDRLT
jgi:hypothetical protein